MRAEKIHAKKVSRRWFTLYASVFSYRDDKAVPDIAAAADKRGSRAIAPYRLFLQALETLDFPSGQNELDSRLRGLKLNLLEALGAGFYSFGAEKNFQYQVARVCQKIFRIVDNFNDSLRDVIENGRVRSRKES